MGLIELAEADGQAVTPEQQYGWDEFDVLWRAPRFHGPQNARASEGDQPWLTDQSESPPIVRWLRPSGCPNDAVCESCPCAGEDDVCFPGERHVAELLAAADSVREAYEEEHVVDGEVADGDRTRAWCVEAYGGDPQRWPPWDCARCGQHHSGWSVECGRCEYPRGIPLEPVIVDDRLRWRVER